MEIRLARATCLDLLRELGHPAMLLMLDVAAAGKHGRNLRLYTMSQDWACIDTIKIIKCKGADGDLIVHLT